MSGHTVSVKFVSREDSRCGFSFAVISTSQFKWIVSARNFEEVHGLSRVVGLIPDKFAVTFQVINSRQPADAEFDGAFFVNLVTNLCSRYLTLISQREPDDPLCSENKCRVFRFDVDVDSAVHDGFQEVVGVGNNVRLSLYSTFDLLRSRLNAAAQLARNNLECDFYVECERVVRLADSILALCTIYLNFVHPLLVSSARVRPMEQQVVQEKQRLTSHLLLSTNRKLTEEFVRLRAPPPATNFCQPDAPADRA